LGCVSRVDDFGTVYSSLAPSANSPWTPFKIDRSFISALGGSKESSALIHSLVQLGRRSISRRSARRSKNGRRLEALQNEDCDLGQGFLFARPLDVQAVEELLNRTAFRPPYAKCNQAGSTSTAGGSTLL